MAEVVHTSWLRLERIKGPLRHGYLEGFSEPIRFGVHGGINAFYRVESDDPALPCVFVVMNGRRQDMTREHNRTLGERHDPHER